MSLGYWSSYRAMLEVSFVSSVKDQLVLLNNLIEKNPCFKNFLIEI